MCVNVSNTHFSNCVDLSGFFFTFSLKNLCVLVNYPILTSVLLSIDVTGSPTSMSVFVTLKRAAGASTAYALDQFALVVTHFCGALYFPEFQKQVRRGAVLKYEVR